MIICLTPNPALDLIVTIPRLQPGMVHRANQEKVMAGGKGVNAARVIGKLGGDALCTGFLGGHTGRLFAELAHREGLRGKWTWVAGETRTSTIVLEESGSDATVINPVGPRVAAGDWANLRLDLLEQVQPGDWLASCGSLAPGSDPADFQQILVEVAQAGHPTWVDTSGHALRAAFNARPFGIKVNAREISEVLGITIDTIPQALAAARQVREMGIEMVVLTLGSLGALLCLAEGSWLAQPPPVRTVSSVGSGDTFLGALLWSLKQELPYNEALRRGAASGAANALCPGSGEFDRSDYERIYQETQLSFMGKSQSRRSGPGLSR